jgi:cell wall assembly regulator SMI1
MDPNQAFEDLLKAIRWGNSTEARESYQALREWTNNGGLEPNWFPVIKKFLGNRYYMDMEVGE